MRIPALVALALASLAASVAAAPPQLRVRVEGLRSSAGRVVVALYDAPAGFPGGEQGLARKATTPIAGGAAEVTFRALPAGTYAVAVLHDEDGDGRLDTSWLGIPTEGIGASNGAQGRFGPARFERAKFRLEADAAVTVRLVYVDLF